MCVLVEVGVPHDVVGLPDVVVCIEGETGDISRWNWSQRRWKDVRKFVLDKNVDDWNVQRTDPNADRIDCSASVGQPGIRQR